MNLAYDPAMPPLRTFRRSTHLAAGVLLLALAGLAAGSPQDRHPFAPPEEPRHYMPERGYDLQHLRLDLTFDWDKKQVSGTATNTLTPLRPGLDHLVFHAVELDVKRVSLQGKDLPFSFDPQAGTLTVDLGQSHAPGEVLAVAIDYTAHPRSGLYFAGPDSAHPEAYPEKPRQIYSQGEPDLNRHWFPSWDAPNDYATSELYATVPRPFQVIGNGRLAEVTERPGGARTYHWIMDQPHPTYLVSMVAGEFARVADTWQGIPVEYYVPPGREAEARIAFGRTPDMMSFFSDLTGVRYPYPKYAQTTVYDFPWGGMENISATTETERALHGEKDELDFTARDLVSHELAHQWFGDLVGFQSWDHAWLSEGFADYCADLYAGHAEGPDAFQAALDDQREGYLAEDSEDYRRPIVTQRYTDPIRMFDAHSYQKGALVLHMIRFLLGEDAWKRGLHEYVARFAHQAVTTADLQQVLEQVSGVPLGPLFDQYVYGAGHPELLLRWDWRPETHEVHLSVEQTQRVTEETGYFSFPVEIALVGEKGTEVHRVPLAAQRLQEIVLSSRLPNGERPKTVVFDPHGWMLKTVRFEKPLSEWRAQLEAADAHAAKLEALRALGALGGGMSRGEAEAVLGQALRTEPAYSLRKVAAQALGALATDAALVELKKGLGDRDSRVRSAAFESLKAFPKHRDVIPVLRRALEQDESAKAKAAAATALGAFHDDATEVAPLLVRALSQPSYRDTIASAAILALADLGAPQTLEQAARLSRYGAPQNVRGPAMLALAKYAAKQKDPKVKEEARRILEGYLDDPIYRVRRDVYSAFAELKDPESVPALERSARNEVDNEQRGHAEEALRATREAKVESPGTADTGLAGRLEQLERESEVLRARIEELERRP
jgi:aminopeptidase N